MKYSKPPVLAFSASALITTVAVSVYAVFSLIIHHFDLWIFIIIALSVFFISSYIIYNLLEKFIYEKIKPIYKLIYSEKAPEAKKKRDKNINENTINNAHEVYNYLVKEGIIVRDRSKIALCENSLRITVGTAEENRILLEKLQHFN